VTVADREAEELLRDRIEGRFPGHGILGEEFGESPARVPVRWILDPIDGTRSFMRGVPLYGVLIGVEVDGEPAVGVAHFPALAETVAAATGLGCRWNGSLCTVSPVTDVRQALILTTDPVQADSSPVSRGWQELSARAALVRTWGDCYGHILVATGRADVMLDPVLSPWDAAPLLTILTEAGGRFTDLDGRDTVHGGSGLSTNGHLHDEVLATLRRR
jgi:histidinol phosphatase-like enzyme (inositol monophosphatase family)